MTKEEILKKVKKFQGANREFSQELPPIIEGLIGLIDEAGPEVADNLESNDPDKALSANMGKELNVSKMDAPSETGEAGQILQLDEEGNPEWVEAAAVGATYDSAVSDTSTNAIQNKTIKKYVDDNFAQKDGYYGSLTAGAAENLVGRGSVPAEFAFRTSGGDQDLGTGSALITKILGRTLVWNQLVPETLANLSENGVTAVKNANGTYTLNGTATGNNNLLNGAINIISGHSYIISARIISSGANTNITGITGQIYGANIINCMCTLDAQQFIGNSTGTGAANIRFHITNGNVYDNVVVALNFTDLTLLGWVPSSVSEFRAVYPLSYYSYTPALLINNAATALEAVGFNQWDEVARSTGYINANGDVTSGYGARIASENYIPVIAGQAYFVKASYAIASYGVRVAWYDANKALISVSDSYSTTQTAPANAAYMRFNTSPRYASTTYNHDICINLSWSGYRNGEYEPYEKHTLNLGLNNLACHDEDDTAVVVNGLDGVGTSYDEAVVENGMVTKIIKRFDEVDLGDLTWTHESTYGRFVSESLLGLIKDGNRTTKLICPRYTSIQNGEAFDYDWNKVIYSVSGSILVHDLSFPESATGADFKAAMAGVKLRFELATPKVLTIDEPFAASYYVNDFGTEARLPQDTADNPQAPFCAEIRYAMNATDTIRRLPSQYISDESMTNILTALKTAGIIADFTLTYDSEHQYYTCSITAPTTEGE